MRTLRVEYPGAMYHIMDPGDRQERVLLDDVDRQDWLKKLAEACQRTGWRVHAFRLMKPSLLHVTRHLLTWFCLLVVQFAFTHAGFAGCDLQIASAGPCLADSTSGIPKVGEAYGLKITLNVKGAPTQPFRIKWTIANVTNYFNNINVGPGNGYWWYFVWWVNLDDAIPWSVILDPDGVSGDTNLLNNTAKRHIRPQPALNCGGVVCAPDYARLSELHAEFSGRQRQPEQPLGSVRRPDLPRSAKRYPRFDPHQWSNHPHASLQRRRVRHFPNQRPGGGVSGHELLHGAAKQYPGEPDHSAHEHLGRPGSHDHKLNSVDRARSDGSINERVHRQLCAAIVARQLSGGSDTV